MPDAGRLLTRLIRGRRLTHSDWACLIGSWQDESLRATAAEAARDVALSRFGNRIWYRGIVEFSNHCACDCRYCGIRGSIRDLERYRLNDDAISSACAEGYALGVRTFVLQAGEDPLLSDERLCALVRRLLSEFPDARITLSVGERSEQSYRRLYEAGARRYLLRHETADPAHFRILHPDTQDFWKRVDALYALKAIGFQTGCGMMIGAPGQTPSTLACDMTFIQAFQPHMIGMGPFLPHHATPFADQPSGSGELTLFLASLCRILLPDVLLPATTALRALLPGGLTKGVLAGCNVVMPNMTPEQTRADYMLYDVKPVDGTLGRNIAAMRDELAAAGYELTSGRGDHASQGG